MATRKSTALSPADYLATIIALTDENIAITCRKYLLTSLDEIIVSSGGTRNLFLMQLLSQAFSRQNVVIDSEMSGAVRPTSITTA